MTDDPDLTPAQRAKMEEIQKLIEAELKPFVFKRNTLADWRENLLSILETQRAADGVPSDAPYPEKYDPRTCITAYELREMGLKIPDSLPDVAWVPRRALRFDVPPAAAQPALDEGCIDITLTFDTDFVYHRGSVVIDGVTIEVVSP